MPTTSLYRIEISSYVHPGYETKASDSNAPAMELWEYGVLLQLPYSQVQTHPEW